MDILGLLSLVPVIKDFIPKKPQIEVRKEYYKSGSKLVMVNTTGREIEITDVRINDKPIESNFFILEKERGFNFLLQNNSPINFTIVHSKTDETPKSIEFYIKRRFGKVESIKFTL